VGGLYQLRTILLALVLATRATAGEFTGCADYLYWEGPDWGSGLRTGIGYQACCWEITWNYTTFGADTASHWVGQSDQDGDIHVWLYEDLDYQVHDFQLARTFEAGVFDFELFGGFRWGKIDAFINREEITWEYNYGGGVLFPNGARIDQFISETDSYGVRFGGEARCYLTSHLSVFGRGAVAGMQSTTRHVWRDAWYPNVSGYPRDYHGYPNDDYGDPIRLSYLPETDHHANHSFDLTTGLTWQRRWLELTTGYEWHTWANAMQTDIPGDFHDVILEGLFARVKVQY
jgi:hypothetical protein